MSELVLAARAAVHGDLASNSSSSAALQQIIDVGTSAGGQRAKAIVNLNPDTSEIQSGHLPPSPGFEPWLLKFDGVGEDRQLGKSQVYGRIEYAYSLMANAAGITTARTRLLEENGRAHFMSRRFDRTPDGCKVHMQTLCALAGVDFRLRGANDYAQLLACAEQLGLSEEAKIEIFRRATLNVAAMNCDDHSKNFAFLLPSNGRWELAPAYDVTFAYNPHGEWNNQHLMAVNGRFSEITRADLMALADRFAIPRAASTITAVLDVVDSWPEFATHAGLSSPTIDTLGHHFPVAALRRRQRAGSQ
jgi:serine/threonine-protein kinase HipA